MTTIITSPITLSTGPTLPGSSSSNSRGTGTATGTATVSSTRVIKVTSSHRSSHLSCRAPGCAARTTSNCTTSRNQPSGPAPRCNVQRTEKLRNGRRVRSFDRPVLFTLCMYPKQRQYVYFPLNFAGVSYCSIFCSRGGSSIFLPQLCYQRFFFYFDRVSSSG